MTETYSTNIIAITQPLIPINDRYLTAEEFIVYTARVSNPSNQMNTETAPKLLKYLIKNRHWSPFEMVSMTVEIVTSRAIATQILRHRSFSFQEFSQRYAEVTKFVEYPARRQDIKNRQNSIDDLDKETQDWFINVQTFIQGEANDLYKKAIEKNIAKEQARMLLPLATQTTLYMTGTLRSWLHYLSVRCDKSTQLEHRQIADSIKNQLKVYFPNITEALEE